MSYLFFCKSRPFGTAVPPGPERKLWPRAVSPAPEWWRPIGEIWGMGMNGVPLFWETRYQMISRQFGQLLVIHLLYWVLGSELSEL